MDFFLISKSSYRLPYKLKKYQTPEDLHDSKGYDHRDALFGNPPMGGSISQNLYYADSDFCDRNVNTHIGYPQREIGENGLMLPWPSPFILMVDRGGCSFVQKVIV